MSAIQIHQPSDREIVQMFQNPFPLELVIFDIVSPDTLGMSDKTLLEETSLPFLSGLAIRFENEREFLSPLMVGFGTFLLEYYIPTPEVFDRYPSLGSIYKAMKDKLPVNLVALQEAHRTAAR